MFHTLDMSILFQYVQKSIQSGSHMNQEKYMQITS